MISNHQITCLVAGLFMAGQALANSGYAEREQQRLEQVQASAGAPVDSVRFYRTRSWEPLGDHSLLVWESSQRAYLLEVDTPCNELPWAKTIAIVTQTHMLNARFDKVKVGRQDCRIMQIRPIDVNSLRAAERETRQARK